LTPGDVHAEHGEEGADHDTEFAPTIAGARSRLDPKPPSRRRRVGTRRDLVGESDYETFI
jgi:hypothetical protein